MLRLDFVAAERFVKRGARKRLPRLFECWFGVGVSLWFTIKDSGKVLEGHQISVEEDDVVPLRLQTVVSCCLEGLQLHPHNMRCAGDGVLADVFIMNHTGRFFTSSCVQCGGTSSFAMAVVTMSRRGTGLSDVCTLLDGCYYGLLHKMCISIEIER